MNLNRIKSKISKIFINLALSTSFSTLNLILGGTLNRTSKDQITHTKHSGIFGKSGELDISRIYRLWEFSDIAWRLGDYQESVGLRRACLSEVVNSQAISDDFVPANFMSVGWSAAIGHLGYLGFFTFGQELGLAPSNHRQIPVRNSSELRNLQMLFQDRLSPLHYQHSYSIFEHASQWHQSERLSIIRTSKGMVDIHQFTEDVFSHPSYDPKLHSLKLPTHYLERAREKLSSLGLPKDVWFVSLHVREKPNVRDARNASIGNYLSAISEITARGGWVVRFGTGLMSPLPKLANVIDLSPESEAYTFLHYYLLGHARFVLVTTSGPMELAKSLGTPVLGTNTTSIARNMQSAPPGTMYIPKKWVRKNRNVSFAELLGGREGYSENDLKEKADAGYQLIENTPEEIRAAVVDMFLDTDPQLELAGVAQSLREKYGAIAKGKIAPSYLNVNEDWFLKGV
jgi:putative glycosyltransferase (TIGR04372 family)